ncbi:hypothetical protein FRB94_000734 [Tulasnella sp. JGI-2019a]|nr:hypothetical protein FRB94_000734 [Tulasnella sp. JGI-2019a]KAG8991816.1 hypothetical protein FRB93_002551 [Tulasnella sp. JGI-2019a]KAG9022980.1 hypothetical protein FRB95_013879 [Tulasnella sp. JGI-2019a]
MGFWDFFYLDCSAYSKRIELLPEGKLRENMRKKIRQMIIYGFGIAGGVGGAAFTHGLSILGAVYSARKVYVAVRKYMLLKAEWRARDGLKHTDIGLTVWDVLGACGAGILTGAAAAVPPAMIGGEIIAYVVIPAVTKLIESDFIPRTFSSFFDEKTCHPL